MLPSGLEPVRSEFEEKATNLPEPFKVGFSLLLSTPKTSEVVSVIWVMAAERATVGSVPWRICLSYSLRLKTKISMLPSGLLPE